MNEMKKDRTVHLRDLKAGKAAAGVAMALAQAAGAAELDTNLVVNGDFETVDPLVSTDFGNSEITEGWLSIDGASVFAYNYAQNYDDRNDAGEVPPGNDPLSATNYYFSMNGVDVAGVQTIDLSSGPTAAAIASGGALFNLEAYFTNYLSDVETGRLTLEFYDDDPGFSGFDATLIGDPVEYDDPNIDEWTLIGGTGEIPRGANWARIVLGQNPDLGSSGGPDVYVDNVSFVVTGAGGGGPTITGIEETAEGSLELIWESVPETLYGIESSPDLESWSEVTNSVSSGGTETRFDLTEAGVTGERIFLRVFVVE